MIKDGNEFDKFQIQTVRTDIDFIQERAGLHTAVKDAAMELAQVRVARRFDASHKLPDFKDAVYIRLVGKEGKGYRLPALNYLRCRKDRSRLSGSCGQVFELVVKMWLVQSISC